MAVPKFVQKAPRRMRWRWKHPWTLAARQSKAFRTFCWEHGYLSPHFSRHDGACHDGTPIPSSLRRNAQRHAFNMERFRHALGDRPLPTISWYRTPSYNRQIGGASQSQHMQADASDMSKATVDKFGHDHFFRVADVIFRNGGVGEYPGGSAHTDSRGWRARWTSF
jgi:hypothetical protein